MENAGGMMSGEDLLNEAGSNSETANRISESCCPGSSCVQWEQLRLLFGGLKTSLSVSSILACVLAGALWTVTDRPVLVTWLSVTLLVTAVRGGLAVGFFRDARAAEKVDLWRRRFLVGSVAAALSWGAAALVLFPPQYPLHQAFLGVLVAGLMTGAVTTLSASLVASLSFAFILVAPFALRFVLDGDGLISILGLLMLLYLAVTLFGIRRINATILQNLEQQWGGRIREEALRTSERNLKAAQRIGRMGHWTLDVRTGHLQWSDEIYRIFGREPDEFEPSHVRFFETVHAGDVERVRQSEREAFTGRGKHSVDHRILRPDGSVRWVHEEAHAFTDDRGRPLRLSGTVQDITERKETEEALKRAKSEADRASRAKSEFLSSMSHELRTPLNAILGFSQLLDRSRRNPLNDKQREQVGRIAKAGQHLLELINEVLDLEKVESGRLQLSIEEVQAGRLVGECVSLASTLAEHRHMAIELQHDGAGCDQAVVRADYLRAKQALLNLLSNAVKYNRPGGEVKVDCGATDDGYLRFEVEDQGPGIPDGRQGELFQPFNRLGAEASGVEGTGIGLLLTKRIVESMDGRIGFYSEEGHGSRFWIDLPLGNAALGERLEDTLRVQGEYPGTDQPRTVLYVEDNPANRHLMEEIVSELSNVRLICTHTAEQGLELAKSERPDLILMDIHLPGMDGIEALTRLQRWPETEVIPVVALSANAMPQAVQEALDRGFRAYLTKPVDVDRLYGVLRDVLSGAVGGNGSSAE